MPEDIKQVGTIVAGDTSPEAIARMQAEAAGDDDGEAGDKDGAAATSKQGADSDDKVRRGSPSDTARSAIYGAAKAVRSNGIASAEEEVPGLREANAELNAASSGQVPQEGKPDTQKSGEVDASSTAKHASGTKDVDGGQQQVKIVVNGEERYYPTSVVEANGGVAAYQKLLYAEAKLAQAAETTRKANETAQLVTAEAARLSRREQELNALEQSLRERQKTIVPPANEADARKGESADSKLAEEIAAKLYAGDEKVAGEAIETLLKATRSSGQSVTPEMIAETVRAELERNRAEERRQKQQQDQQEARQRIDEERQEANKVWKSEYRDLAVDPDMAAIVQRRIATLQALPENEGKSLVALTRLAAEEARKKFGAANTAEQRRQEKILTPTLPVNSATSSQPAVTRKKTGTETVNELRRARGQPPL